MCSDQYLATGVKLDNIERSGKVFREVFGLILKFY